MFPVIFQFLATTYKTDYIHSITIKSGSHICLIFLLWWSRDKYLLCRYCLPTDQPSELIDGNLSHSVCKLLKTRTKGKTFFSCQNIDQYCKRVPERRGQEMKYVVEKHFLCSHIKCSLCNGIVFSPCLPLGIAGAKDILFPTSQCHWLAGKMHPVLSTQYAF